MIRKAEGQSKSAFADRLGISRNTLAKVEAGSLPVPEYIALAATCIYRRVLPVDDVRWPIDGLCKSH
jgi:transcriptional regulator with XRE-family HTH domain